jgi:hypothetical protein
LGGDLSIDSRGKEGAERERKEKDGLAVVEVGKARRVDLQPLPHLQPEPHPQLPPQHDILTRSIFDEEHKAATALGRGRRRVGGGVVEVDAGTGHGGRARVCSLDLVGLGGDRSIWLDMEVETGAGRRLAPG